MWIYSFKCRHNLLRISSSVCIRVECHFPSSFGNRNLNELLRMLAWPTSLSLFWFTLQMLGYFLLLIAGACCWLWGFSFKQFWVLWPSILQWAQKDGCFSYWTWIDKSWPSLSITTVSNIFSERSTSTKILANIPNRLCRVASLVRGVPNPEAISNRVFFRQYSWGSYIKRTHICAWVWTWLCGM